MTPAKHIKICLFAVAIGFLPMSSVCAAGITSVCTTDITTFDGAYQAANRGVAKAQFNLGVMYENGQGVHQNYAEVKAWYAKAANQGFAQAQYNLGVMYDTGLGVRQSDTQAKKWFSKAANQGFAQAQYNLGVMYGKGQGVRQNYTQAKKWYGKACDNGYEKGCAALNK